MSQYRERLKTIAYNELRASEKGLGLIELAEANAASAFFDEQGEINKGVFSVLSAHQIYQGVTSSSSLTFTVERKEFTVRPYFNIGTKYALSLLEDYKDSIEHSLMESHAKSVVDDHLPGASKNEILDVCIPDFIEDYDTPETTDEWPWIERNACYSHRENGKGCGVWEFVLNMSSYDCNSMPQSLRPIFDDANSKHCQYILFHQGT